jgi:hypothetical protein
MTKLSPAAQAVYDAVLEICPAPADEIAAATLRAAAEHVVHDRVARMELRLVADELEGDHD